MPAKFHKVVSFFKTTLKEKMTDSQTTMKLNDTPGGVIEYPCWAEIEPNGLNKELIYLPSANSGDTFSSIVRGLDFESDNDTDAGSSFRTGHISGVDVIIAPVHRNWNELVKVMRGLDGTGTNNFLVGDSTDSDITYYAKNADALPPFIQYNAAQNKWLFSNDGSSTYDPSAGGSGLTSGQGIQIVASAIKVRLKTSSGLRIDQGAGTNEMDVDPTITARLDTANTWTAVQTLTADRLQVTTDADSGNDAVRKAYLDTRLTESDAFFATTDISGAEAEALTNGSTTALHAHGKSSGVVAGNGSTTQNIAHGLGVTPKLVVFHVFKTTSPTLYSHGSSNGTTHQCIAQGTNGGGSSVASLDTSNAIKITDLGTAITATAAFTSTNVTLTWSNSGNSSFYILWEVYA